MILYMLFILIFIVFSHISEYDGDSLKILHSSTKKVVYLKIVYDLP